LRLRSAGLAAPLLLAGALAVAAPSTPGPDPLDAALAPPPEPAGPGQAPNVWVTGSMAKVRRTDPPGQAQAISLSAARNEVESFQVHLRALTDLTGVTVQLSDLVDPRGGGRIVARHFTVSRQLYQQVPHHQRSDQNGLSGDLPDALVPARDRYYGEQRNAFPASVPAGQNLSAWIDLFVPPGTPSGWYLGHAEVKVAGRRLASLPIQLKVWNFDLPSTASLPSHFAMSWNGACVQEFGSYEQCGGSGRAASRDAGVEQFHLLYARFGLDRRISIANVTYAGPRTDDWRRFDALYGPLLDGRAETRSPGARLTAFTYAGGEEPLNMSRWVAHFRARGWLDRLVYYRCDEPGNGSCSFADARAEGQRVHAIAPDFRTLLTTDMDHLEGHGLLETVDIVTPVVSALQPHGKPSRRPLYEDFLARTPRNRIYWYQSCSQHESCANGTVGKATSTWPSYMVDATPVRNRVFQWLAFLEGIQGELYYAVDYCFTRDCGPAGAARRGDPFSSIYAFGGHGDGTLLYPGNTRDIGGTHHVPLSSIRLELIREGMEDYELLHLLELQGEGDFARARARAFIRRTDDFSTDPAQLLAAREALGDRLHARSLAR
jgi:hypothetical protein